MPDQVQNQNQTPLAQQPSEPAEQPAGPAISATEEKVIAKINDAHNILIALSSDPSVDEISAAIGLAMHLDRMGKRATAIYSGHTPNALEFLKPDETFETSADALQDFVIALSKEKADHLRYKLDGDYVKIYITPYKARISEEDLDFSYGDYNVDLVLALGVSNGIDLDSALREHGRIMHDATIVNVTTGNPGKFGEIEWSNKATSSVSEMLANLLYNIDGEVKIDPEEATAFLTGIVAATDRFSKANTTADTMEIASRLMDSGAKHQLISKNITADLDNRLYDKAPQSATAPSSKEADEQPAEKDEKPTEDEPAEEKPSTDEQPKEEDEQPAEKKAADEPTPDNSFNIRGGEEPAEEDSTEKEPAAKDSIAKDSAPAKPAEDNSLLEELKNAEANLASASAVTRPDVKEQPVELSKMTDDMPVPTAPAMPTAPILPSPVSVPEPSSSSSSSSEPSTPENSSSESTGFLTASKEKVIAPPTDFAANDLLNDTSKYGKMLEDALAESSVPAGPPAPAEPSAPAMPAQGTTPLGGPAINPAASIAPDVASAPEINGVPEINYAPTDSGQVLPPPPMPPVSFDTAMPSPEMPPASPTPSPLPEPPMPSLNTPIPPAPTGMPEPILPTPPAAPSIEPSAPAPSAPVPAPESSAPSPDAFRIPGM